MKMLKQNKNPAPIKYQTTAKKKKSQKQPWYIFHMCMSVEDEFQKSITYRTCKMSPVKSAPHF